MKTPRTCPKSEEVRAKPRTPSMDETARDPRVATAFANKAKVAEAQKGAA